MRLEPVSKQGGMGPLSGPESTWPVACPTRQRGLDVIACVWVAQVLLDLGARLSLGRYSPANQGKSRPHLQRKWATRSTARVVVLSRRHVHAICSVKPIFTAAVMAVMCAGCVPLDDLVLELPWARHTIDDASRGADGVRLADVNGDGLLDVATGWEEGGVIRVCLHPGAEAVRNRWPAVTVGQVGSPEDAVFVDLDNDGAFDVVSASEGSVRTVWIHWAPSGPDHYLDASAWWTEAITTSKGSAKWMFTLPLDVDGQNGIDLVAGAKGDNARIGWFRSPSDPRNVNAWTWHPLYVSGWIMSLVPADIDGDGDMDIVASDRKGDARGCLWLENPGPGTTQLIPWPEHRIGVGDRQVMFIDVVDLDEDGLLDVLAAARGQDLAYYRQTGSALLPWQTHTIAMPAQAGTGKAVRTGDIDLDGRVDIVFSCENAGDKQGVMWLSYPSDVTDPLWSSHPISGTPGAKFDLVELVDLDNDGDLDVMTCEEKQNLGVLWYENPTVP